VDPPTPDYVPADLSDLLRRADQADPQAADQLFATLYGELRRLAEHHLERGASLTLSTTSLVHDAYLSMVGREGVKFPDRARFFAYASRAMRGLVIDYARRRRAKKRGREYEITLVEEEIPAGSALEAGQDLQQLADALDDLAQLNPDLAELVDLHFFAGFSFGEIAEFRGVSERTVQRDWRKARLLLHHALKDDRENRA
jgi:RNA polymerase sigma factor (TIGR02999 family)